MKLEIKPLSVNEAWRGRRFKTPKAESYRNHLLWILPKVELPEGDLFLAVRFGLGSKGSDVDNCLKNFIDSLQVKYKFNDNRIKQIFAEKVITKKGEEFIEFKFFNGIDFDTLEQKLAIEQL